MTKYFVGGYIEIIATLVFLAAGLVFARVLRGQSETNRWLASCIAGATAVLVAVTLATSYAAGAAALYGGHHGTSLATVTTINDIRNFGWAISTAVGGVVALAVSAAGHLSRRLPRWLSYVGYTVGAVLIGAMPLVKAGEPQGLLFFVWLIVLGIVALRRPGAEVDPAFAPAA
jgi:hypothetical protein